MDTAFLSGESRSPACGHLNGYQARGLGPQACRRLFGGRGERHDLLVGVGVYTRPAQLQGGDHRRGNDFGPDRPEGREWTQHHARRDWSDRVRDPLTGAWFGAVAEQRPGLEDLDTVVAESGDVALGLTLDPQQRDSRLGVGTDRRDDRESLRSSVVGQSRRFDRIVVIDAAELLP